MAVETTFTIQDPKKLVSAKGGLYDGMFNDDLTFTFEAKDFHTTDPREVSRVFADLDFAVQKVKEAWNRAAKA